MNRRIEAGTAPRRSRRGGAGRRVASRTFAAGIATAALLLSMRTAAAQSDVVALPGVVDTDVTLPDNPLTAATLFKLMMSEIAAQRGAPDASYATELKLAHETRDPRIARRATEFAVQARQPAAAVEAARLWAELSPASRVAADTYLTLLVLSARFDEAEPLLAAKIAAAPSKSQALVQVYGLLTQGPNRAQIYATMRRPCWHLSVAAGRPHGRRAGRAGGRRQGRGGPTRRVRRCGCSPTRSRPRSCWRSSSSSITRRRPTRCCRASSPATRSRCRCG